MTPFEKLEAACIKLLTEMSEEPAYDRHKRALEYGLAMVEELTDEDREIARRYLRIFRTTSGIGNAK
jgi:hypothetical protein